MGGPQPTVIKVANLSRRLYFIDDVSRLGCGPSGTASTSAGISCWWTTSGSGGAGLYQRLDGRFGVVCETPERPEIADLIDHVHLDPAPTKTPGSAAAVRAVR
jgi:hypothetical protein